MTTVRSDSNLSSGPRSDNESNKELVLSVASRGWHPEMLTKKCSHDYQMHFGGSTLDLEGLIEFMGAIHYALPNLVFEIYDVIAEGDKVVTRWNASGTHLGKFQGVVPTKKPVHFTGITISRIENGKIVEDWEEVDQLNFAQQFGSFSDMF